MPAGVAVEAAESQVTITATPLSLLNSAIALAMGVGLVLVAIGLFRRARWSYPGTLIVSATMIVLIVLQFFNGGEINGSAVIQLLVFGAIFVLFLYDSAIKQLLWIQAEEEAAATEE